MEPLVDGISIGDARECAFLVNLILRPLVVSRERMKLCPWAGTVDVRPLAVLLTHPAVHAVACSAVRGQRVCARRGGEHGLHVRRCLGDAAAAAGVAAAKTGREDDEDETEDEGTNLQNISNGPWSLLLPR